MYPRMAKLEGVPSLVDMTPLTFDELPDTAKRQGAGATADALRYNLGWFRHDATGLIFLGLATPDASDHSRWVVCADPDRTQVWYNVLAEGVQHPRTLPVGGLRMSSTAPSEVFLSAYLKRLRIAYDLLVVRARRQGLPEPTLASIAEYDRIVPQLGLDALAVAIRYDPGYLHGILHHYDAWAAENPEFAEMPRDIVMRMHGIKFHGMYEGAALLETP